MRVPTALFGCHVDRTAFDYRVCLDFSALDPDEAYRVDAELVIEAPLASAEKQTGRFPSTTAPGPLGPAWL
jgi:hypothetical protein